MLHAHTGLPANYTRFRSQGSRSPCRTIKQTTVMGQGRGDLRQPSLRVAASSLSKSRASRPCCDVVTVVAKKPKTMRSPPPRTGNSGSPSADPTTTCTRQPDKPRHTGFAWLGLGVGGGGQVASSPRGDRVFTFRHRDLDLCFRLSLSWWWPMEDGFDGFAHGQQPHLGAGWQVRNMGGRRGFDTCVKPWQGTSRLSCGRHEKRLGVAMVGWGGGDEGVNRRAVLITTAPHNIARRLPYPPPSQGLRTTMPPALRAVTERIALFTCKKARIRTRTQS